MTRKKERDKASIDYADKFMAEVNKINDEQWKWAQKHPDEPTVAGGVKACWIFQRSSFLAGAEWADKTILNKIKSLIKEWELCTSAEAKYKVEAYKELMEIIEKEE